MCAGLPALCHFVVQAGALPIFREMGRARVGFLGLVPQGWVKDGPGREEPSGR